MYQGIITLTLRRARLPLCRPGFPKRPITTSASDAAEQMKRAFAGQTTTRRQVLDGNQLQKLSLTLGRRQLHPGLDVSENAPPTGTPLPAGYHLVYFTPVGVESELGPDGTDRTFNAPAPFTRRMWAGGRMRWMRHCQLRVGEEAEERTRLLSAAAKRSRDGSEMVLVDVEKQFWNGDGLALVDQRSWVFRPEVAGASDTAEMSVRSTMVRGPPTVEDLEAGDEGYPPRQIRWSPVGLFRFSALTFNGHKIHYDPSWSSGVEGHPGVVVHGPLNLISMLDYWRDVCKDGTLGEISYRAMAPLYAGDTYQIRALQAASDDEGKKVWGVSVEKDRKLCMKGSIIGQ